MKSQPDNHYKYFKQGVPNVQACHHRIRFGIIFVVFFHRKTFTFHFFVQTKKKKKKKKNTQKENRTLPRKTNHHASYHIQQVVVWWWSSFNYWPNDDDDNDSLISFLYFDFPLWNIWRSDIRKNFYLEKFKDFFSDFKQTKVWSTKKNTTFCGIYLLPFTNDTSDLHLLLGHCYSIVLPKNEHYRRKYFWSFSPKQKKSKIDRFLNVLGFLLSKKNHLVHITIAAAAGNIFVGQKTKKIEFI